MFKIYGSEMCPDCINCKASFDKYDIEYEFIDINKSLRNLKVFLDMRDKNPVFDHCKEIGDIGLPALVKEDGKVFLSWEKMLIEKGLEPLDVCSKPSCSITGKGC